MTIRFSKMSFLVHCDFEKGSQNQHFQSTLFGRGHTNSTLCAHSWWCWQFWTTPNQSVYKYCMFALPTDKPDNTTGSGSVHVLGKKDCKYLINNTHTTVHLQKTPDQSGLYDKQCLARFPTSQSQMAQNKTQTLSDLHNDPHNKNLVIVIKSARG